MQQAERQGQTGAGQGILRLKSRAAGGATGAGLWSARVAIRRPPSNVSSNGSRSRDSQRHRPKDSSSSRLAPQINLNQDFWQPARTASLSTPAVTFRARCQPGLLTTCRSKRAISPPILRCACSPCSTYCQVRLCAPSGARLVLTHFSCAGPRHVVRSPG